MGGRLGDFLDVRADDHGMLRCEVLIFFIQHRCRQAVFVALYGRGHYLDVTFRMMMLFTHLLFSCWSFAFAARLPIFAAAAAIHILAAAFSSSHLLARPSIHFTPSFSMLPGSSACRFRPRGLFISMHSHLRQRHTIHIRLPDAVSSFSSDSFIFYTMTFSMEPSMISMISSPFLSRRRRRHCCQSRIQASAQARPEDFSALF